MFDTVGNAQKRDLRTTVTWAVGAAVRSRMVRVFAALIATVVIGLGLYVTGVYRGAHMSECRVLPGMDPSMEELIGLRERVTAYQGDPSPRAALDVSGRELSFLFGGRRDFQMRAEIIGDRANVDLAVPTEGGCWNVRYVGALSIRQGVVVLTPDEVVVGESDLSRWLAGRTWRLSADQVPDDVLARTVRNTSSLDLEEGMARVRLSNRWDVW